MGDGGGCEVGYGYMHNSPFHPPRPHYGILTIAEAQN